MAQSGYTIFCNKCKFDIYIYKQKEPDCEKEPPYLLPIRVMQTFFTCVFAH